MNLATIILNFFLILGLVSAVSTVIAKRPIHAILSLVLTFGISALILMIVGVEYLPMTIVIVYVGAIAILFLFVIMMLNINLSDLGDTKFRYLPLFIVVTGLIAYPDIRHFNTELNSSSSNSWEITTPGVQWIGQFLYTEYYTYLFAGSIILVVSMVGAIALTLNLAAPLRRQDLFTQVNR